MSRGNPGECGPGCRSLQHGAQVCAAIIRGSEAEAIAYLKGVCHRFCFVTDNTGKTALHTAASCGKQKVVKFLLCQGAALNQRDWESGYTPLHRALFYGQLQVACTLIQAGGSVSSCDLDGLTPLDHLSLDRPTLVSFSYTLPTHAYVWGSNTNYNLGQSNHQHGKGTPECVEALHREGHTVTDVAMSKFHTLFVTGAGRVYACGHGQGGRLGLDTNASVISPRPLKAFASAGVVKVAVGPDHSLFLTDAGQVWSCGRNLYHQLGLSPPPEQVSTPRLLPWHKAHREEVIAGVGAAKYHSVMWSSRTLYTFGLNAGQLGHFKNANERTIITPRNVSSIVLKEDGHLACVGVSDGATVLSTSHGDIYVLHQYQIRKVASKMLGVVKVACLGGQLDCKLGAEGLKEHGGDELKIAVLIGGGAGQVFLWTEKSPQLSSCVYNISRKISVVDICLSRLCLGIVTDDGEAFSGVIQSVRQCKASDRLASLKPFKTKGQVLEGFHSNYCFMVRLSRIPALHRTLAVMCDPKGHNFASLQNDPSSFLTDLPQMSPSTARRDYTVLLEEASEVDMLHDMVVSCGGRKFPVHSFILASHSQFFAQHIFKEEKNMDCCPSVDATSEKLILSLPDVDPNVFKEILTYIYTGTCKFTSAQVLDRYFDDNLENLDIMNGSNMDFSWTQNGDIKNRLAYPVYKEEKVMKTVSKGKKKKGRKLSEGQEEANPNPIRGALNLARKLEITQLVKDLEMGTGLSGEGGPGERVYRRGHQQQLWDVMISSKTGEVLGAHKCVLAARLEYFHCMFGASWVEARESRSLSMPLPSSVLTVVLDYLYEDDSPKLRQCRDPEFVCNVLVVADQFLIPRLVQVCEQVVAGLLTLRNAAQLLAFAATYNAAQLKRAAMQFICLNLAAILENGSLLTITNSGVMRELTAYYRCLIPNMACRFLTPFDCPPTAYNLQQALEENPIVLPESDEEWDDSISTAAKGEKAGGSARKKKRSGRKDSLGDGRSRKASTSSSISVGSSDCDPCKDLEDDLVTLSFDDLEERGPMEQVRVPHTPERKVNAVAQGMEPGRPVMPGVNSWQKVSKKKGSSGQLSAMELEEEEVCGQELAPTTTPSPASPTHTRTPGTPTPLPCSKPVTVSPLSSREQPRGCGERSVQATTFPSLQDTVGTSHKTPPSARTSKVTKLSQKQRKKLAAAEVLATEASKVEPAKISVSPSCPWGSPPPMSAWGGGGSGDLGGPGGAVSGSQSLAAIMRAEETSVKRTAPVTIPRTKKVSPVPGSAKHGLSRESQPGPSTPTPAWNLDGSNGGTWSSVASSPPSASQDMREKGPAVASLPSPSDLSSGTPKFTNILMEEEIRSDNYIKEQSKPLAMIQLEDRAIEELLAFYGAADCHEETITVTRVRSRVANPTWSK